MMGHHQSISDRTLVTSGWQFAGNPLYNRHMSETLDRIIEAPNCPDTTVKRKTSHRGAAPAIRKLAINYPELSHSEIARQVGCSPSNVTGVLKSFLGKTSEESLRAFQENKADVYDALQHRLLLSLTQSKIAKAKPMEIITGAAILEDKARLVRGQATGINVSVLMDVVEAMRLRGSQPVVSAPIGEQSVGE